MLKLARDELRDRVVQLVERPASNGRVEVRALLWPELFRIKAVYLIYR